MFKTIKDLLKRKDKFAGKKITIEGWITSSRGNNKIRFMEMNDGSTVESVQLVIKGKIAADEKVDALRTGSALKILGEVKLTPESDQVLDILVEELKIMAASSEDFPLLQKGKISLEKLREIPHIRHRTKLLRAVMLIRSTLALEIHNFFASEDYQYFSAPIITGNDGEGVGETFIVDDKHEDSFFGKKATLGVTGQLHGESYALGFKKIYTFGPTFRAENSNTTKHASEFWMIEPEVSFCDLNCIIGVASRKLKYVITKTLDKHEAEFKYLETIFPDVVSRLKAFLDKELNIIDYKDVIVKLNEVKDRFVEQDIIFGTDLGTEHERYLCEVLFQGPVAVINYPKSFKAFYMHLNEDDKSVAAFDLLVPGIGELIGGSQREMDIDKLLKRIEYYKIDPKELQWYLDLRKYGNPGSAGYGLGFERLVQYVTGIENIRDVIPYPRTPRNMKM